MQCYVCGNKGVRIIFYKEDLAIMRCSYCSLIQLDEIRNKFDIKNYDYYKNRINLTKDELYRSITTNRFISLLKKLEPFRKHNALLDIGCGEGHFLSTAQDCGWKAEGVEISDYAARICKQFNLKIHCGDLRCLSLPKDYYDSVIMFEVIEHLLYPKDYINAVYKLLRKNGVLLLTTPNFNCLTRHVLQNKWSQINKEHLYYFTYKTLSKLLTACGFRILKIELRNITIPEFGRLFNEKNFSSYEKNQVIREVIESRGTLLFFKKALNSFLNLTHLGESIQCLCQKK